MASPTPSRGSSGGSSSSSSSGGSSHHHHGGGGRGRFQAILLLQVVIASCFLVVLHYHSFGGAAGGLEMAGGGVGGSSSTRLRSSPVAYQPQSYLDTTATATEESRSAHQDDLCITDADLAASHAPGGHGIIVASPLRNGREYLPAFLSSLAAQQYPRLTVVIYDDNSDDGGPEYLEEQAQHGNLPFRLLVVRGRERLGPAYAKWRLIEEIRAGVKESPMDLVLFLDADDKLAHPRVLEEVDAGFQSGKPWFAWGRIRGYYEEECGPAPPITYANGTSSVRTGPWRYCHPRILRAFLLDHYVESDFRDTSRTGQPWLQKYTDRQLVYKALELSGDGRVKFLDAPKPHVYYRLTMNSTVFLDPAIKKADRAYVDAMPAAASQPLPAPVHIVTCAFARVALLREVLAANIEAQDLGDGSGRAPPPIYLHVCNNGDIAQQERIEAILRNVTGLAGYRLQTFPDNPGGFARFRMMQRAMQEFPVDYFVMIDDDIKLPPKDGLRTLLAHARPREYNSWWGRHYKPAADYYFSRLTPKDLKAGLKGQVGEPGAVTTFHYAGTGLSILDADMVRLHAPLLEKLPKRYRKVEDLWLSYVAYQIGWRVRRIPLAGVGFLEDNVLNPDEKTAALVQQTALWRQLKNGKEGDLKKRMLEDLRKCGWNVR